MADQSKSRGWRKDAPVSAGRSAGGQRAWQKEAAVPAQTGKAWSRNTKILLGLVGSLVIVGAFVVVILLLRPPKPVYVLTITAGYETNLAVPANLSSKRAAQALKDWAGEHFGDDHQLTGDDAANMDWLDKGKNAKKVIIFVSAQGGADKEGAYLVPNDYNLGDRKLVRVKALIDQLKKLPPDTQKVLILDVTQVQADWALGMVHNDFARALKKLDADINSIPNLIVLSASDADQRSWESDQWGMTIFAHAVVEGLKGAADGAIDQKTDTRVFAAELYAYTKQKVSQWAHSNRDALQTPVLLGGSDRADGIELAAGADGYKASKPETLRELPSEELSAAWKASEALRKPSGLLPAAYAPHLWRQYLDSLLRYEQLARARDAAAGEMKSKAEELREKVIAAARLQLDSGVKPGSLQLTLTMPAALGYTTDPKETDRINKGLNRLWEDKKTPLDEYSKLIEAPAGNIVTPPRIQLSSMVFDVIRNEPSPNLEQADLVLTKIDDVETPRPAESHFLVMLHRRAAASDKGNLTLPAELIQKALQVRRLAEEAAVGVQSGGETELVPAYTEQVHPWIRKKVENADRERRLGEDLLFASDKKEWAKAEGHLETAKNAYAEAQKNALVVRQALKARDQVMAELPYYSQWLARQRLRKDDARQEAEERIKLVEALWKNAHQLAQDLQQHPDRPRTSVSPAGRDLQATDFVQPTAIVNKVFASVVNMFDLHCKRLSSAALQEDWHEIEAALTVPFIDPGLRLRLLETSRDIAKSLHDQPVGAGGTAELSPEQNSSLVRHQAERQGRMALAVLGPAWINGPKPRLDYDKLEAMVSRRESEWWTDMVEAGEQIGDHWARMLGRVNTLTKESGTDDLEKASGKLTDVALLARQLDGAAASLVGINPVDEHRRLQMHDLLLWQADRTYRDHWFGEDDKPYYSQAAKGFVSDARNLAAGQSRDLSKEHKDQRLRSVREMEKKLEPEGLVATWFDPVKNGPGPNPSEVKWTDEGSLERKYEVKVPAGVEGYPVVWATVGEPLKSIGDDNSGRRVLNQVDEKQRSADVTYKFGAVLKPSKPSDVPKKVETQHVLNAYFRGQIVDVQTKISLYDQPDIIVAQPEMPLAGRVAVQAKDDVHKQFGTSNTKLVIVLDATGSMNFQEVKNGPTRFNLAVDALKAVLRKPFLKGAKISLWMYGQEEVDGRKETPESTILRKLAPITWDPSQVDDLIKKIRNVTPYHHTPLIRAMYEAKKDFQEEFNGFKTMLVLTDGMDDRFQKDPEIKRLAAGKDIPAFLREQFDEKSGILVNVIGFQVEIDQDDAITSGDFKKAIETLPLPGRFHDAKNSADLAAYLEKSMLRKLRYVVERNGVPPPGMEAMEEGLDISRIPFNPQPSPGLPPALYTVRVKVNRSVERGVRVERGDHLLLNLIPDAKGFAFERDLYALSSEGNVRSQPKGDWLFAIHQNKYTDNGELEAMATLENAANRRVSAVGTIQQIKPRMIWFSIKGAEGKEAGATGLRFGPLARYWAPAWGITVSGWPRELPAVAEAWWIGQDQELSIAGSLRQDGGDFTNPLEIAHRPIHNCAVIDQEEQATVVVESVRAEKRVVEIRPGERKEEDCVVVRLSYPKGKAFFADVPGAIGGHEHRFYTDAGKYTGVFFRLTPEQARTQVKVINLYSLENFKRKAINVPNLNLGVPKRSERRPRAENE